MKLKNKKTGEVVVFGEGIVDLRQIGCKNVAEMIEAGWEDCEEECRQYWYLEYNGEVRSTMDEGGSFDKWMERIGNHFDTEEEAEKAVKKLIAWKRLKDKGFKFSGVDWMHNCIRYGVDILTGQITFDPAKSELEEIEEDLTLLFGGEEEDE